MFSCLEPEFHICIFLTCLLAPEKKKKKNPLKTLSKFMAFTVFQNTATAVNYYVSNKQICRKRSLYAECIWDSV